MHAIVGWSTTQQPVATYDQGGFGESQGDSVKARLIALISAVRTLLRCTDPNDTLCNPLKLTWVLISSSDTPQHFNHYLGAAIWVNTTVAYLSSFYVSTWVASSALTSGLHSPPASA